MRFWLLDSRANLARFAPKVHLDSHESHPKNANLNVSQIQKAKKSQSLTL